MITGLSIVRPPKVDSNWNLRDYLGTLKVRLSFGRNSYRVKPGLYALQDPKADSEVFVTANYKLSFDILRRELDGLNAWILVLDTKGINVWCAAGKETFGTKELIRQINEAQLYNVVNHKRLILPQLGAPGVSADQVKQSTGFLVKFGPVRASDIKDYLQMGKKKTAEMRTVKFDVFDRLKILPVEIVTALPKFLMVSILFFLISGLSLSGYSIQLSLNFGLKVLGILFLAYLGGTTLTPFLLPWIPFRSFAAKGLVVGSTILGFAFVFFPITTTYLPRAALFLIGIAISSFLAMNFTGASTYTSLSGVRKEMRIFVPVQIMAASIGFIVFIISRFIII